jgi:hypothetical protein
MAQGLDSDINQRDAAKLLLLMAINAEDEKKAFKASGRSAGFYLRRS